jgi:hypothetical protein
LSSFTDKVLARGMNIGQSTKTFTDQVIAQGVQTRNVYADAAPESAASLRKALQWLRQAKRYGIALPLIPHGEEERRMALMGRYGHAVAVPPPTKFTVFEYEHGGSYSSKSSDLTRALSTRRVALCVDIESVHGVTVKGLSNFVREPDDAGGLLIWPINYFDEKRDWEFSASAVIIPRHACLRYVETCARQVTLAERLKHLLRRSDVNGAELPIEATFLEMLPEIARKLEATDRFSIYTDTAMDAVWVVLGTLGAMQCSNVVTEDSGSIWVRSDGDPSGGRRIALDPFHGRRAESSEGARWEQDSTLCLEQISSSVRR